MGYTAQDYTTKYAKYYDETIQSVPPSVKTAFQDSPFPAGALPPFAAVSKLQAAGYADLETGYTRELDNAVHVAVLTKMPHFTPEMWDWWFGWHGCKDNRYKVWHPKAHISAHWEDGSNEESYIGRNSIIAEYIGDELTEGSIQFKSPAEFGFSAEAIKDKSKVVYTCNWAYEF